MTIKVTPIEEIDEKYIEGAKLYEKFDSIRESKEFEELISKW